MSIKSITTDFAGEIGVKPRLVRIETTDSFATITTANYLKSAEAMGYTFYPNDAFLIAYGTNAVTTQLFTATISGGVITLEPSAGDVVLPVAVNHIAVFTNTAGTLGDNASVAINYGSIHAGAVGQSAGSLASFSGVANAGGLYLTGLANASNVNVIISNASHGQSTTYTIPDGGASTGKLPVIPGSLVTNNFIKASGTAGVLADAGARIISNTTGTYAGGGTSNTFAATGLTSSCKGTAVIRTSTNSVSITKALPGTDTLAITFSADPGAGTTVDYIYTTAAMS